jgi:hypothetical protein
MPYAPNPKIHKETLIVIDNIKESYKENESSYFTFA